MASSSSLQSHRPPTGHSSSSKTGYPVATRLAEDAQDGRVLAILRLPNVSVVLALLGSITWSP